MKAVSLTLRDGSRRVGTAWVEASLAGALAGLLDLAMVISRGAILPRYAVWTGIVSVGFTSALVSFVGIPVVLLVRLLGRHPTLRAGGEALRTPGPSRVEALVLLAFGLAAVAAVWTVAYEVVARIFGRFNQQQAAALLAATSIIVAGLVVLAAVSAVARPVARRIAGIEAVARATSVARGLSVAAVVAVVAMLIAHEVIGTIAPAWDRYPRYVVAAVGIALVASAALGLANRLGLRRGVLCAGVCTCLGIVALYVVGQSDGARRIVHAHGVLSKYALDGLWRLTDQDGDRYSDRFGGADCDDSNPLIHPGRREIAGNGLDDNCVLGDLPLDDLAASGAPRPSAYPGAERRDIVLVTIDTVRADYLGVYGGAARTPVIDALAARGTRFERAYSPQPSTRWAMPALALARYPATLPFGGAGPKPRLQPHGFPTTAQILHDLGYATGAVGAADVLPRPALIGIEHGRSVPAEERGPTGWRVTDGALDFIRTLPADKPYFLWLHYHDPHAPYLQHPDIPTTTGPTSGYESEIAYVDAQLGRLFDALAVEGRIERTIIAVSSDHGEGFGEHGARFHNRSLYDEQTRVPLVIAVPGAEPQVVKSPVSIIDIGPTLLDLVGVAIPAAMNGVSLARTVRERAPVPDHPVLTELRRTTPWFSHQVALHVGHYKVIRDNTAWTHELYDLEADPAEVMDISDRPLAKELVRQLDIAVEREFGRRHDEPAFSSGD